ncbi:unnamed protein product [Moneuplotes crassus]|uniref:Uncharacterized protein n=1 Tax=Euplotes crassus TaxID=5936 RepID=A0AAD1UGA8_EUPCR|nr:unnamed protein product [Moneuplotes crassus]
MLKMKEEFNQTCSSGGQQEHEGSRRADEKICEFLCECARKVHPEVLEARWGLRDRANGVRRFVNEYIENNQVPKDQKVILVGHYGFFLYYTQEWDKEYSRDQQLPKPEEISTPENCFTMKNSQFLPGVLRILTKTSKIVL